MENIYLERTQELKKNLHILEKKLNVKIVLQGKKAVIEGDAIEEYEASQILEAIGFGFSANTALTLQKEDMQFRIIPIKLFTRRKNMTEVRGRIIGAEGKSKNTIEQISGCKIKINEKGNQIGVIGHSEQIDSATTAITNLIRGSKHSNVYHYLEQSNARRKHYVGDLGLKKKK